MGPIKSYKVKIVEHLIIERVISLLAYCVFETVFAVENFEVRLEKLHQHYTTRIKAIVSAFHIAVKAPLLKAQEKNLQVSQCVREYDEMLLYYEVKIPELDNCRGNSLVHRNLKQADDCYKFPFAAVQCEAILRRKAIETCIKEIIAGRPYNPRPRPRAGQHSGSMAGPSTLNQ